MIRFSLVIGLFLGALGLWAVDEPARFALVIGNASYGGDAQLANSVNDATAMGSAMASIGWKVTQVLDGDRHQINDAIDSLQEALKAQPGSVALFYYAGHGVQIGGQNYLIPVREGIESANDVVHNAIPLSDVLNAFDEAQVSTSIVVMDACRDNPFGKKKSRSLGIDRGLTIVSKPTQVQGTAVLFATAPGETASDGTGSHGVFTQAILKYLKTDLKLQDFVTKVTSDVKKATGGKQVPYNSLSLSDDFYLVPASLRSGTSSAVVSHEVATLTVIGSNPKPAKSEIWPILGWTGLGTGVLASGVAVWQYMAGADAYASYTSATDPATAANLHSRMNNNSTWMQVSAVAAGVLIASGITAFFVGGSN